MLGLPPGTAVDRLRYAYEQHMADAVRSHDHARALSLSRAFDALGATDRSAIYSRVGRPGQDSSPAHSRSTPSIPARKVEPVLRMRFLVAVVAAPAALILIGSLIVNHAQPTPIAPMRPGMPLAAVTTAKVQTPAAPPPQATMTVTQSVSTPVFLIEVPLTAPTEANGMVRIGCEAPDGKSVSYSYAHRGQYVSCGAYSTPIMPGS
jgi:hypothetical protein